MPANPSQAPKQDGSVDAGLNMRESGCDIVTEVEATHPLVSIADIVYIPVGKFAAVGAT